MGLVSPADAWKLCGPLEGAEVGGGPALAECAWGVPQRHLGPG